MRGVQSSANQFPRLVCLLFSKHLTYASNQVTDSKEKGEKRKNNLLLILNCQIIETVWSLHWIALYYSLLHTVGLNGKTN